MANLMYAEMAMKGISTLGGIAVSREQARMQRIARKHQRVMSALSASFSRNAITENEITLRDNSVFARLSIQSAGMQERAEFDVEAAAAGAVGASVDAGRTQLIADEQRARTSMERQAVQSRRQFGAQRSQVAVQQIMQQDISPIPRANIGAQLLGLGGDLMTIWNAHNPVDRQITTRMARGG